MKFETLPEPIAQDSEALLRWCSENFRLISNAVNKIDRVEMVKHGALPAKYKDGEVFYFLAGVTGGGAAEGLYCREAGAWVKL